MSMPPTSSPGAASTSPASRCRRLSCSGRCRKPRPGKSRNSCCASALASCRKREEPLMDFALPSDVEALRRRVATFVHERIVPLETERANYDEHENIALDVLRRMRDEVKAAGLWSPQLPK